MIKSLVVTAGVVLAVSSAPVLAQTTTPKRVQVSVCGGWVFADGVETTTPILAPDGNIYDRVDPKDSGIFGVGGGALIGPNAEVGFMYSRQFSNLTLGGTNERELGDLNIDTYHGYFAYNFFDPDARIRPFALIGFGATNFSDVNTTLGVSNVTIPGQTKFSTTWAAGVNFFPAPRFGVRAAARWTPTYIKSDSAGWWCDPFWGCYLVGDPQYANQFELSGGFTVRF
jgi:opacity protein-like surface antigen